MQTRSLGSHRVTGLCHLVILAAAALSAAAQTPAEPPGLPSLLDVGPISIAPCPCVAAPARRLPEGALRRQADDRAAEAARLLSAFEIADAEAFVDATVADAARQAR